MKAEIEVFGAREAALRWRTIAGSAQNIEPFLRAAGRILLRATAERFDSSPWKPLDADTVRQKAASHRDPRVLRATGKLERALTIWGAPGQRMELTEDQLIFGLVSNGKAYYGRFHQDGAGVPRRVVLTVSQAVRGRLRVAARNHLLGRRV